MFNSPFELTVFVGQHLQLRLARHRPHVVGGNHLVGSRVGLADVADLHVGLVFGVPPERPSQVALNLHPVLVPLQLGPGAAPDADAEKAGFALFHVLRGHEPVQDGSDLVDWRFSFGCLGEKQYVSVQDSTEFEFDKSVYTLVLNLIFFK